MKLPQWIQNAIYFAERRRKKIHCKWEENGVAHSNDFHAIESA